MRTAAYAWCTIVAILMLVLAIVQWGDEDAYWPLIVGSIVVSALSMLIATHSQKEDKK